MRNLRSILVYQIRKKENITDSDNYINNRIRYEDLLRKNMNIKMNFDKPPKIELVTYIKNESTKKVLNNFDIELNEKAREMILTKIDKVDHIGILVSNIYDALERLNLCYSEAKYEITKQFDSVAIPKNYEGSTSTIAHINPINMAYPGFEFFVVNWGEKYEGMSDEQKRRFIEHTALNTIDQQGV
jgi:hypothetical protein